MKTKSLLFILLLLITQLAVAQITFQHHYGGIEIDAGSSVLQTADGGYIVAGLTKSYGAGGRDVFIIKTNEYGDTLWSKTYGGLGDDEGHAIQKTNDNGYIITGSTASFGSGGYDVYLIKTDENGDTLWTKTFGGAQDEDGWSVQQTNDNGFIIVGGTLSFGNNIADIYLIKTDENGDTIWTKTFGERNFNSGASVRQTNDNGYVIVGSTYNNGDSEKNAIYFIKTDENGDTIWTKTFGEMIYNYDAQAIQQTNDNGYIIVGNTTNNSSGGIDALLIKTDINGNIIWSKTYGGTNDDWGNSVQQTNDNGYIISGSTKSFGSGGYDVYLIKTDENGDTLWTKTFGGTGDDGGGAVQQTNDNGYIISGSTTSFGNYLDVFLIKTDENGYAGFENSFSTQTNFNLFPNPCSGIFTIQIKNVDNKDISVEIINQIGQTVYSKPMNNTVSEQIDLADVSKGIYFVKIIGSNINITEKVIIY